MWVYSIHIHVCIFGIGIERMQRKGGDRYQEQKGKKVRESGKGWIYSSLIIYLEEIVYKKHSTV